jgi:hypothetical protein
MTPEGRVKAKVRDLLNEYGSGLYHHWPVPSGYGRTTIDVLGCYRGFFFAIEAKAPKKKPTLRQSETLQDMGAAMGKTFVIDDVNSPVLGELRAWLDNLRDTVDDRPHITPDATNRRVL